MTADLSTKAQVRRRAVDEFKEFAVIAIYLYIFFTALLYLKATILKAHGIPFAPFGLAAVKAIVCAKFVSVGHVLGVGERFKSTPLIWAILYKSLAFLVLLLALNALDEVVVGLFHHRTISESLSEIGGGTFEQLVATSIVGLLVLIPFFAFRSLGEVLGERNLVRLFLEHRAKQR